MSEPARAFDNVANAPSVEAAYLAVPPERIAEIIDGELHVLPRPRTRHTRAATKLGARLDGPFDQGEGGPGGWIFLIEPELHLGLRPDKIGPDLAGWTRDRMPELPDVAAITLSPDWVCEVLSESTAATDRGRKMRIYRRESVGHYWLVDPVLRTLEVYRLASGQWLVVDTWEGDVKVRAEPFDAVELDLALLWAR